MAQLKDTLIQGSARVTDTLFTNILNVNSSTTATLTDSVTRDGAITTNGGLAVGEAIKVGKLTLGATYGNNADTHIQSTGSMTFKVASTSGTVYTSLILDETYVLPYSTNSRSLGKSDRRWSGVYTNTIDASSNVTIGGTLTLTNALSVSYGGTGSTSFTANGVIVGNGTDALAQRGIYITGALGANAALSTTDAKTLTIASGSTLYLDAKEGASHIFRKGETVAVRINTGGMLEVNSSASQTKYRLLVNGDSGFTNKIAFTVNSNSPTEYASISYDSTLNAIKFVF